MNISQALRALSAANPSVTAGWLDKRLRDLPSGDAIISRAMLLDAAARIEALERAGRAVIARVEKSGITPDSLGVALMGLRAALKGEDS